MSMIRTEAALDSMGVSVTKLQQTAPKAGAANVPSATTTVPGTVLMAATQAPAAAADVAALKTQFDALLVKLKAAGLMANA